MGMRRVKKNLTSRQTGLLLNPFADRFRDCPREPEQVRGHQNRTVALPIFQRQCLGINVLLNALVRLHAGCVPGHWHWYFGRNLDRCQPSFPLTFRGMRTGANAKNDYNCRLWKKRFHKTGRHSLYQALTCTQAATA